MLFRSITARFTISHLLVQAQLKAAGLDPDGVQWVELAFPQMADCLVCHTQVDPPFTCEFCHAKDAKLKPANHPPEYLESHSRRNVRVKSAPFFAIRSSRSWASAPSSSWSVTRPILRCSPAT